MTDKKKISPRRTFENIIHGRNENAVLFSIWNNKLPSEEIKNELLSQNTCIIVKSGVYKTSRDSISAEKISYVGQDNKKRIKTIIHTGSGELYTVRIAGGNTNWREEYIFKSKEDYDPLLEYISSVQYTPDHERFNKDDALYGENGIARPSTEKSPMFEIIYDLMGVMNFAIEWHERRSHVLEVYKALLENRRKCLSIVADSPAQFVIVDGNIEMSVVGDELFKQYYAPVISEACDILKGKMTGLHLDGKNKQLIPHVSKLPVNIIESFTPVPDCDMTLREAMEVWPDKRFIVNFPSSLHIYGKEEIKKAAQTLLKEAKGSGRVIIGICEDVPTSEYISYLAGIVNEDNIENQRS